MATAGVNVLIAVYRWPVLGPPEDDLNLPAKPSDFFPSAASSKISFVLGGIY